MNKKIYSPFWMSDQACMGPLQFRKMLPTEVFEVEMTKIVGPMLIMVDIEGSSPNYNEIEISEIFACKFHQSSESKKNMWEVNLALASEKLYLINNLNDMIPEMVMDIQFSEYSELLPPDNITNAKTANSEPIKHDRNRFILSRNGSRIEFLPLDLSDFY